MNFRCSKLDSDYRRKDMAARTVAKDIITLRGSAAIVSEFFGIPIPLLFSRFPPISFIFCIPVYFFVNFCLIFVFFWWFFQIRICCQQVWSLCPAFFIFLIYYGSYFLHCNYACGWKSCDIYKYFNMGIWSAFSTTVEFI